MPPEANSQPSENNEPSKPQMLKNMEDVLRIITDDEVLARLSSGASQADQPKLPTNKNRTRLRWLRDTFLPTFREFTEWLAIANPEIHYTEDRGKSGHSELKMYVRPFLENLIPVRRSGIQESLANFALSCRRFDHNDGYVLQRQDASYFFGPGTQPYLIAKSMLSSEDAFTIPVVRTTCLEIIILLYVTGGLGNPKLRLLDSEINSKQGTIKKEQATSGRQPETTSIAVVSFEKATKQGHFTSDYDMTLAQTNQVLTKADQIVVIGGSSRFTADAHSVGTEINFPTPTDTKEIVLITDEGIDDALRKHDFEADFLRSRFTHVYRSPLP